MIASSDIPRHSERVAARVIEERALVVVIDAHQLHRLNPVATRIWQLCDGRSVEAIAAALVGEFEVDPETALGDVCQFLEELSGLGAIRLEKAR